MSETPKITLTDEDVQNIKDILGNSKERSSTLLRALSDAGTPFEAFVTLALSLAATARILELDREDLLEGVGAAFDSIQVETHHVQ